MYYDNYDEWWNLEPTKEDIAAIEAEAKQLQSVHEQQ